MATPVSVDAIVRELHRLRGALPAWVAELTQRQACGEAADGRVRAYCTPVGEIVEVAIDTRFLRSSRSSQVDAAILAALQAAQSAAAQLLEAYLEKLQFMGIPIGETLSGMRSPFDLFAPPPQRPSPQPPERHSGEDR